MTISVVAQPEPLVSLDEAKLALGESGDDWDSLIEGLILAAQAELDGPSGWVGVSIAEQTLAASFDAFDMVRLKCGPVDTDAVDLVYRDVDGEEQPLDPGLFTVTNEGCLRLASGQAWPALGSGSDAIRVTYGVGVADPHDPRVSLMKTAMIMHVKMTRDMEGPAIYRQAIEGLVQSLKAWSV